jgi:hypothetical protein
MPTTLDDGTLELDRLFAQVERRKTFTNGKNQGSLPSEAHQGLVDALEYDDLYQMVAAASAGSGLQNGTFINAPPDFDDTAASYLDTEDNQLPSWTITDEADFTDWHVYWKEDTDGPDGASMVFEQIAGMETAGEAVALEQTISIDFYRRLVTTIKSKASNAGMQLKVDVQFLDTDGAAVGSELSMTSIATALGTLRFWREPPLLATQARIRFGCVNTTGVASQTRTVLFISVEEPTVYSVNIPFVYSFLSPAISTSYTYSYPSDIIPNGVYIPDTQGFVLGISAKTSDTITAGTGTVRAQNDTQATNPGPTVVHSAGDSVGTSTFSLDGVSTYHFEADDELSLEMLTNGAYASTGSADYRGSLRLLLVVNDEGDWS